MAKSIFIKGDIGIKEPDEPSVTLKDVIKQNPQRGDIVYIDSRGGLVSEGDKIYNLLKPLGVTTVNIGRCYSIATKVFLAGETRIVNQGASFMIHNPWADVSGDAKTLQEYADELIQVEEQLVQFYSKMLNIGVTEIAHLMSETTFINAEQAVELNLATKIEGKTKSKPKAVVKSFIKPNNRMSIEQKTLSKIEAMFAKYFGGAAKNIYTITGADGETQMYVDAKPEDLVGRVLFVVQEGQVTEDVVPEGDYQLQDETTIKVGEDGIVSEVGVGEQVEEEEEESDEVAKLKMEKEELENKLSQMESEKEQLAKEKEDMEKMLSEVGEELKEIKSQMIAGSKVSKNTYRKDPVVESDSKSKEEAQMVLKALLGESNAKRIKIK